MPTKTFRISPPELEHTCIVRRSGELCAYVKSWSNYDNETFIDRLPWREETGAGPYSNFHPWNRWLGEQLMYAQSKRLGLSAEEVDELITIANFGSRFPDMLAAMAINPPTED